MRLSDQVGSNHSASRTGNIACGTALAENADCAEGIASHRSIALPLDVEALSAETGGRFSWVKSKPVRPALRGLLSVFRGVLGFTTAVAAVGLPLAVAGIVRFY